MKLIVLLVTSFLSILSCTTPSKDYAPVQNPEQIIFTDTQLQSFLKTHPRGIIYVLSPQMTLSLLGLKEYEDIAKSKGLAFLPLLDPSALVDRQNADLKVLARLASRDLIERGATQHFPAFLFYKDGVLYGKFNPGYDNPEIFQVKLEMFLKSKQQSTQYPLIKLTRKKIEARKPANFCDSGVFGRKREIHLPVIPTFFIRVDTDSRKLFMSGDCVISLNNGSCISRGRTWEPYPVAGFDTITIPTCDNQDGLCFYDTRNYKNQESSKPFFFDPEMKGYYQSVGFLRRSETDADIRVINYYGFMRDYKIKRGHAEAMSEVKRFCPDYLPRSFKLPMLSKNGKFISGWDDVSQKTVISQLHDDGSCKELMTLDVMISKMDWSYDGKLVAFHVSSTKTGTIAEDFPNDIVKQDLFLMNVETKKITRITFGPELFYYPHFGRNGLLYSLKTMAGSGQYSVVEIDPRQALKDPRTALTSCTNCQTSDFKSLTDLSCN